MATAVAEPQELAESLRSSLQDAAPQHADLVLDTLVEAISAKKHVSVTCRKCNTTTRAEILDAMAATSAIRLLLDYTEGRPAVAADAQDQALTFTRIRVREEHVNVLAWAELAREGKHAELADAVLLALETTTTEQPRGGAPPAQAGDSE